MKKIFLFAPAKLYEIAVRSRLALYEIGLFKTRKLNAPVISVGNLTVGGTGKTPCVAYIANFLNLESGNDRSVAILSRGYKRESAERVEVSDGREILCGPAEAGDEPYLLARNCPGVRVIVDRDRYTAGRWLEDRATISAFVLDDGYQHLRLARDLNLLLIDATDKLNEARMVPFGRLREPIVGIHRADAVIVTRSDEQFERARMISMIYQYARKELPIFFARHEMTDLWRLDKDEVADMRAVAGKPIAAVSGIARPEKFVSDLVKIGMRVALRRDFDDHHRYSREEFVEIVKEASDAGARAIVTTEKDAANLPLEFLRGSGLPIYAAGIQFRCEDEEALKNSIRAQLSMNRA